MFTYIDDHEDLAPIKRSSADSTSDIEAAPRPAKKQKTNEDHGQDTDDDYDDDREINVEDDELPATNDTTSELKNIKVELEGRDLWERFNELGTEMIITKSGR